MFSNGLTSAWAQVLCTPQQSVHLRDSGKVVCRHGTLQTSGSRGWCNLYTVTTSLHTLCRLSTGCVDWLSRVLKLRLHPAVTSLHLTKMTYNSSPWWWRQHAPLKRRSSPTRRYIPENFSHLHNLRRKNLKFSQSYNYFTSQLKLSNLPVLFVR
jgi:hypothetical protein